MACHVVADEFGIMLQQDFPLAGCGWTRKLPNGTSCTAPSSTCTYDWLSNPVAQFGGEDGLSVLSAQRLQIPAVLRQLMSHPSVVRYTSANEFYMNRTDNPFERTYEDLVRAADDTRMAREADPTCVGQRHGRCADAGDTSIPFNALGCQFSEAGCALRPASPLRTVSKEICLLTTHEPSTDCIERKGVKLADTTPTAHFE